MKKFTKWEIGVIKTTAKNVNRFYDKQHKLSEKIQELEKEFRSVDCMIDSFEKPIRELTDGYTTADLLDKVVRENGSITYVLKYPETVVPVEETPQEVLADTPVAPQSQPVEEVEDLPDDSVSEENTEIDVQDVKETVDNEESFFPSEEASEIDF